MPRPRSDEKRARILKASIEVFAREGFFDARISDVAKKAGVADGTIYLYFKNKGLFVGSSGWNRLRERALSFSG